MKPITLLLPHLKVVKNVVSANKKMIAENLSELIQLQEKHNVSLLYEALCMRKHTRD